MYIFFSFLHLLYIFCTFVFKFFIFCTCCFYWIISSLFKCLHFSLRISNSVWVFSICLVFFKISFMLFKFLLSFSSLFYFFQSIKAIISHPNFAQIFVPGISLCFQSFIVFSLSSSVIIIISFVFCYHMKFLKKFNSV